MGTDRTKEYEAPCPCGSGTIIINSCTPDHPWPTKSHWYESKIDCVICDSKYTIEEHYNQLGLVEKAEVESRKNRFINYNQYKVDFLSSKDCQDVIYEFINLLDSKPSIAAIHRFLITEKLINQTYGTFNKHWKGTEKWVKERITLRPEDVLKLSQILGFNNVYIEQYVIELKRLWNEYKKPLPFLGEKLIDIMPY